MTTAQATDITGGLSSPSKMPCPSYNLPPDHCKMGSALRLLEGSACSKCYARKGRYCFANVKKAHKKRLDAISHPNWVDAMAHLINTQSKGYFRWHDSGDIQSEYHLRCIFDIADATPDVKHWLPTKEWGIVAAVLKYDPIPANMNIRISSPLIDTFPKFLGKLDGISTSVVVSSVENLPNSIVCPATTTRHTCDSCRKCWIKEVKCVCYLIH